MSFLLQQIQQLGMVVIVMICATAGTVGILKIIKKIIPGNAFPQDPISKKLNEKDKKWLGRSGGNLYAKEYDKRYTAGRNCL